MFLSYCEVLQSWMPINALAYPQKKLYVCDSMFRMWQRTKYCCKDQKAMSMSQSKVLQSCLSAKALACAQDRMYVRTPSVNDLQYNCWSFRAWRRLFLHWIVTGRTEIINNFVDDSTRLCLKWITFWQLVCRWEIAAKRSAFQVLLRFVGGNVLILLIIWWLPLNISAVLFSIAFIDESFVGIRVISDTVVGWSKAASITDNADNDAPAFSASMLARIEHCIPDDS